MCSSEIVLINVFKACFALLAMFGLSDSQQKLLIAQDDHVFGVFYTQSVDVFYRYLKWRYFFQHQSDIEDLISDIYIKIRKGLWKFDPKYRLESYIWSILKNHLKDYFKKKKLEYKEQDEFDSRIDASSGEDMYIEMAEKSYKSELIQDAMQRLDEVSYQILFFKLVEDLKYDEIADLMWINQATLRKRYSRAIYKLRKILEDEEAHIEPT